MLDEDLRRMLKNIREKLGTDQETCDVLDDFQRGRITGLIEGDLKNLSDFIHDIGEDESKEELYNKVCCIYRRVESILEMFGDM